jgi:hypothetical protein
MVCVRACLAHRAAARKGRMSACRATRTAWQRGIFHHSVSGVNCVEGNAMEHFGGSPAACPCIGCVAGKQHAPEAADSFGGILYLYQQLSEPMCVVMRQQKSHFSRRGDLLEDSGKEVIQPQVPLRLPCYDFAPVMMLAFGRLVLAVPTRTSGAHHFHGVTGGVYKARERIHRSVADLRLLAIPASCRRVAADNPN